MRGAARGSTHGAIPFGEAMPPPEKTTLKAAGRTLRHATQRPAARHAEHEATTRQLGAPRMKPRGPWQPGLPSMKPPRTRQPGKPSIKPPTARQAGSPASRAGSQARPSPPSRKPGTPRQLGEPRLNQRGTPSIKPPTTPQRARHTAHEALPAARLAGRQQKRNKGVTTPALLARLARGTTRPWPQHRRGLPPSGRA